MCSRKCWIVSFFDFFLHLPHRQFSFIDLCLSSKMYWTFNCSWDNVMKWNVFFFCVLHIFQNFPCTLGEKSKSVSFSRVYVCVKAKLTLVSFFYFFFYAPFPNLNSAWNWNLKRPNSTSAYVIIDSGGFWTRYSRFQGEKSNVPYFSMPRGVTTSVSFPEVQNRKETESGLVVRMISLDDMHSENIWFSWFRPSNYQEKFKCCACDIRTNGREVENRAVYILLDQKPQKIKTRIYISWFP